MNIAIASSQICYFRGGAERASLRLAHEMRSRGHAVHILTVTGRYSPVYPIDPRLSVHFFPGIFFHRKLEAIALGPALLQEQRIDVLVSLESDWKHAMWYACSERAQIPFVYSERITPTYVEDNWSRDERLFVLEKAAAIHELLPCYLKYIPEHLRSKTFILPSLRLLRRKRPSAAQSHPSCSTLGASHCKNALHSCCKPLACWPRNFPTGGCAWPAGGRSRNISNR